MYTDIHSVRLNLSQRCNYFTALLVSIEIFHKDSEEKGERRGWIELFLFSNRSEEFFSNIKKFKKKKIYNERERP